MSGGGTSDETAKCGPGAGRNEAFLNNVGKGRVKGVPNKMTVAARTVIAEAATKLGGVERLVQWAREDPKNETHFWTSIYPRLIPVQLTGEDGGPIQFEQVQSDADAFTRTIIGLIARAGAGSPTGDTQH